MHWTQKMKSKFVYELNIKYNTFHIHYHYWTTYAQVVISGRSWESTEYVLFQHKKKIMIIDCNNYLRYVSD